MKVGPTPFVGGIRAPSQSSIVKGRSGKACSISLTSGSVGML